MRRIIITIEDNVTDTEAIELVRTTVVHGGEPYQGIYTFKSTDVIVAANLNKTKATTFYVKNTKLNQ